MDENTQIVTFGKHKGKHITELLKDIGYVEWMKNQEFIKTEKFKNIFNIVITGNNNSNNNDSSTPEHNSMQNLFLNEKNVSNLIFSSFPEIKIKYDSVYQKLNNIYKHVKINKLSPNKWFSPEWFIYNRECIFEDNNWDVTISFDYKHFVNLEIAEEEYEEFYVKFKYVYDNEISILERFPSYEENLFNIIEKINSEKLILAEEISKFNKVEWERKNREKVRCERNVFSDYSVSYSDYSEKTPFEKDKLKIIKYDVKLDNINDTYEKRLTKEIKTKLIEKYNLECPDDYFKFEVVKVHGFMFLNNKICPKIYLSVFWPNRGRDMGCYKLYCELKPLLGDDYPCVLRKINKSKINYCVHKNIKDCRCYVQKYNIHYNEYILLVVKQFSSAVTSKEELVEIFNRSGIKTIFIGDDDCIFEKGVSIEDLKTEILNLRKQISM